jgi:GT2 family glycosyltransferase
MTKSRRDEMRLDWSAVKATVIIPFHRHLGHLAQSLPAARRSLPDAELLVAADAPSDDCTLLAAASGARIIDVAGPSGPAVARNRAAAEATGDVLVFVDADVVVAPDALSGMYRLLEAEPEIAGVFGAYGVQPPERNFISQYKNLVHAYVHETGNREATTFWAGLGAIRTSVFRQVGGFDERIRRPSVEDIELGYRIRRAGHRLRLDPRFRGEHLKRWTLWSSIDTDVRARGIPWTQLILKYNAMANDLNMRRELRWSVALTYLLAASVMATAWTSFAGIAAAVALASIITLNRHCYVWLARQRGLTFALKAIPVHILHHFCNGISFVAGSLIYAGTRMGVHLPGAVARRSPGDNVLP